MPIIYMHGVNTRDPKHFEPVGEYLRRIVAPAISKRPDEVSITSADWFQFCDPPKWGGISRPDTVLLGQGTADDLPLAVLDEIVKGLPRAPAAASGPFITSQPASSAAEVRIDDGMKADQLADLITLAIARPNMSPVRQARVGVAADKVSRDPVIRGKLGKAKNLDEQLEIVAQAVAQDVAAQEQFVAAGPIDFFRNMKDRVGEAASRLASAPAVAATIVAGEARPFLNDFVTRFLGDVLFYMTRRGTADAPGDIPGVLIGALERAQADRKAKGGEPIVLLTHSMGGQVAYDTVCSFLPAAKSDIKVDFWCATASQVGFFEELNMFLASSKAFSEATGKVTPLDSPNLGKWWNVWDHNDIISFTTTGIFATGIDDEEYWTGMSLAAAHGGYLQRPSFYRRFADKLAAAFPGGGA